MGQREDDLIAWARRQVRLDDFADMIRKAEWMQESQRRTLLAQIEGQRQRDPAP